MYTGGPPTSTNFSAIGIKFVLVEFSLSITQLNSTKPLITNLTSTNFMPIALKFVLVEFIVDCSCGGLPVNRKNIDPNL